MRKREFYTSSALLFMLLAVCLLAACKKPPHEEAELPPRPSRGYVLWLGKQAMHNQATALLAEVSQSEKMWLNSAAANRFELLLEAAPNWLSATARDSSMPAFSFLAAHVAKLPAYGINGLYLGETGETGSLWLETQKPGIISLEFDPGAGDPKSFEILRQNAETAGVELGSTLLGAATGLGPDFILQARVSPESSGIYAMLEIPADYWPYLPATKNEWNGQPISSETKAKFAEAGLIPAKLGRDSLPWTSPSGWAATGEIAGLDGKTRRWLYRYANSSANPVLMWTDPFGQARRILSAAIIQQTGIQGQTLTGLRFEPLFGLEPEALQKDAPPSLAPGLEALNALAAQIHRYGGWAIQADPLPPQAVRQILDGDCDFCADDVPEIMALACLLGAPIDELASLYRERIKTGLDFRRLAHGFNATDSLPCAIAESLPTTYQKIGQAYGAQMPALKNLALSLQNFLLLFRLGQPGLAFLAQPESETQGDGALVDPSLATLLKIRKNLRLAEGKVISVFKNGKSGLAVLSNLPAGGHWLTLLNFDSKPLSISLTLPFTPAKPQILPQSAKNCSFSERKLNVTLDGTQCLNVIFSKN